MPLLNVPGTRSGDSLPAELRSGVSQFCGTPLLPSLRLSASGAGLSGMSIHYGATEGPWGYRAYNWPPFGYRGMSGLGQTTCDDQGNCYDDTTGQLVSYGGGTVTDTAGNPAPATNCLFGVDATGQCTSAGSQAPTMYTASQQTPVTLPNGQQATASHPPGYTGSLTCPAGYTCPQAPPGYAWAPVISASGQMLAQILAVSQGGSYSINPRTGQIAVSGTPGAPAAAAYTVSGVGNVNINTGTILLMGGAALLLVMVMMQGKK